jgi:hypothetical protein
MENKKMKHDIPIEYDNEYLSSPRNRIVAVINSQEDTDAAVEALKGDGKIAEGDVVIFQGRRAAENIDVSGEEHGVVGMVTRTLQNYGDEKDYFYQKVAELEQGHNVVSVAAGDEAQREQVIRILKAHNAHAMIYHGDWVVEVIPDREK